MQCRRAELSIGNLSDRRFVARGPGWLGPRAAYFERTIAFESTEPNDLNGAARPSEHSLLMKDAELRSTDKLLRKWEVADRLACSVRTVEREVNDGHLTRVKVRRNVGFRESEVNKIINRRNNDL